MAFSQVKQSNNRSVMPLDVRGRTRATMAVSTSIDPSLKRPGKLLKHCHIWDSGLKLFHLNEEFLVSASH